MRPPAALPDAVQLAALNVLILHIDQLKPDVINGDDDTVQVTEGDSDSDADEEEAEERLQTKETVWQDEETFKHDFNHAKSVSLQLCKTAMQPNSLIPRFRQALGEVFMSFQDLMDNCIKMRYPRMDTNAKQRALAAKVRVNPSEDLVKVLGRK